MLGTWEDPVTICEQGRPEGSSTGLFDSTTDRDPLNTRRQPAASSRAITGTSRAARANHRDREPRHLVDGVGRIRKDPRRACVSSVIVSPAVHRIRRSADREGSA